MLPYFLLFIIVTMGFVNTFLRKTLQLKFKSDIPHYAALILLNGVVASVFFYISAGFRIVINPAIIFFSAVFAALVIVGLVLGIVSLKYNSILYSGIIGSSGGLVMSVVIGALFFGEKITGKLIFEVVIMLTAVLLPWIKNNRKAMKAVAVSTVIVCLIQFFMSGWSTAVSKWFAMSQGTENVNSFFFLTNVLMIFAALIVLSVSAARGNFHIGEIKSFMGVRQIINIASTTVLSNIQSVIVVYALTMMDISMYTITTTSIGMIGTALISRFLFSENLTVYDIIAMLCSVGAIVISNIF